MAMTSADIQNQSFSIDRKGYDVDEVDVFLEHVAQELDQMNSLISQLQGDLDDSRFSGLDTPVAAKTSSKDIEERDSRIAELEHMLEEKKADDAAIAQALIIAQRSGDEIIANANADAMQTRQDAEDEAQRILDKANNEKQRVLDDIKHLQEDREDVRGEYQDILKDFISSATKKLTEIGGEGVPLASSSAHAKSSNVARSVSRNQVPVRKEVSTTAATYTTPQASSSAVVVPVTPRPSKVEKDLSGFGDADDTFEFDEID